MEISGFPSSFGHCPGLDYQRYEDHVTMSNPTKHGWSTCVTCVTQHCLILFDLTFVTFVHYRLFFRKNTGEKPPEKRKTGNAHWQPKILGAEGSWLRHMICAAHAPVKIRFFAKAFRSGTSPNPQIGLLSQPWEWFLWKSNMTLRKEKERVLAQVELSFSTGFACCRDPAFHIALNFVLGITRKSESLVDFVEEKTEVMSAEVRDATSACLVAMGWFRVCVTPLHQDNPYSRLMALKRMGWSLKSRCDGRQTNFSHFRGRQWKTCQVLSKSTRRFVHFRSWLLAKTPACERWHVTCEGCEAFVKQLAFKIF